MTCLSKKEPFLANAKNINGTCVNILNAKITKFIGRSLHWFACGERTPIPQFSDHYFTGDYPVKVSDAIWEKIKITQLSLLSGKSSS